MRFELRLKKVRHRIRDKRKNGSSANGQLENRHEDQTGTAASQHKYERAHRDLLRRPIWLDLYGGWPVVIPSSYPLKSEIERDIQIKNFIWRLNIQDSIQNAINLKYKSQLDEKDKQIKVSHSHFYTNVPASPHHHVYVLCWLIQFHGSYMFPRIKNTFVFNTRAFVNPALMIRKIVYPFNLFQWWPEKFLENIHLRINLEQPMVDN